MAERISQREQELLEEFLCSVLDDFSKGSITRHQAVSGIATYIQLPQKDGEKRL